MCEDERAFDRAQLRQRRLVLRAELLDLLIAEFRIDVLQERARRDRSFAGVLAELDQTRCEFRDDRARLRAELAEVKAELRKTRRTAKDSAAAAPNSADSTRTSHDRAIRPGASQVHRGC